MQIPLYIERELYSVQCTLYTVQCTVYRILYTVPSIVYSVQCTIYTVYTVPNILNTARSSILNRMRTITYTSLNRMYISKPDVHL